MDINLLPPKLILARNIKNSFYDLSTIATISFFIVMIAGVVLRLNLPAESQWQAAEAQKQSLIIQLHQMNTTQQNYMQWAHYQHLKQHAFVSLNLLLKTLNQVADYLSPQIKLDKLSMHLSQIMINGEAKNIEYLQQYVYLLEKHHVFKHVNIMKTTETGALVFTLSAIA